MTTRRTSPRLTLVSSNPRLRESREVMAIDESTYSWDTELLNEAADDDLLAYATGALGSQAEERVRERLRADLRYRAALGEVSKRLDRSVDFASLIRAVERPDSYDSNAGPALVVDWRRSRVRLRNLLSDEKSLDGKIGSSPDWSPDGEELVCSAQGLVVMAKLSAADPGCLIMQVFPAKLKVGTADIFIESESGEMRYLQVAQYKYFEIHQAEQPRFIHVFAADRRYQVSITSLSVTDAMSEITLLR